MLEKLRRAIRAVKDGTSIGLARVRRISSDLAVLKATTHEEVPADDSRVEEVVVLASSSPAACVTALSRRLGRTRDWVVAIKCLQLVHRLLRDGGPSFPREVFAAIRHGGPSRRLLHLSDFRDGSGRRNVLEQAAFVRAYAMYLEELLECLVHEKLSRPGNRPGPLLDRVRCWTRLLDRAIATRPAGAAGGEALVRAALREVALDTFGVYANVGKGVAVLREGFVDMDEEAHGACARASRQAEELAEFYEACRLVGAVRWGEYPHVERTAGEVAEWQLIPADGRRRDFSAGGNRQEGIARNPFVD